MVEMKEVEGGGEEVLMTPKSVKEKERKPWRMVSGDLSWMGATAQGSLPPPRNCLTIHRSKPNRPTPPNSMHF